VNYYRLLYLRSRRQNLLYYVSSDLRISNLNPEINFLRQDQEYRSSHRTTLRSKVDHRPWLGPSRRTVPQRGPRTWPPRRGGVERLAEAPMGARRSLARWARLIGAPPRPARFALTPRSSHCLVTFFTCFAAGRFLSVARLSNTPPKLQALTARSLRTRLIRNRLIVRWRGCRPGRKGQRRGCCPPTSICSVCSSAIPLCIKAGGHSIAPKTTRRHKRQSVTAKTRKVANAKVGIG